MEFIGDILDWHMCRKLGPCETKAQQIVNAFHFDVLSGEQKFSEAN